MQVKTAMHVIMMLIMLLRHRQIKMQSNRDGICIFVLYCTQSHHVALTWNFAYVLLNDYEVHNYMRGSSKMPIR